MTLQIRVTVNAEEATGVRRARKGEFNVGIDGTGYRLTQLPVDANGQALFTELKSTNIIVGTSPIQPGQYRIKSTYIAATAYYQEILIMLSADGSWYQVG